MVCKEEVCSWFAAQRSADRVDLLCGLLQLCLPLELRFVGACLEELARKDCARLKEFERRANDPELLRKDTVSTAAASAAAADGTVVGGGIVDTGGTGRFIQPAATVHPTAASTTAAESADLLNLFDVERRARLTVGLSLLRSDNAVAAHVLFKSLSRLELAVRTALDLKFLLPVMLPSTTGGCSPLPGVSYDLSMTDLSGVELRRELTDDLVLLLTMAIHHPAFTYSQRQQLYLTLKNVEKLLNYKFSEKARFYVYF